MEDDTEIILEEEKTSVSSTELEASGEELIRATLMLLLHNHLEHLYELFRPIPEDAKAIERLQENPIIHEESGYANSYRILKEDGELILRTLNTLQVSLAKVQSKAPDARLAIGLISSLRNRLIRPVSESDYFYVEGTYDKVCRDISLLQDTVACTLSEATEDPTWTVSEKLYIIFGTKCPICHKIFSTDAWKAFEKALEVRRQLSLRKKTQYGIPFYYKYVAFDVQAKAYRYFPFFSVLTKGAMETPILIYYNPLTLKLIIWHSAMDERVANSVRARVENKTLPKDLGPFTKILDCLPIYFIPKNELSEAYRKVADVFYPSWSYVYRVLFEEKPVEKMSLPRHPPQPSEAVKKRRELKMKIGALKLKSMSLYPSSREMLRDIYLTHMCDILFMNAKPCTLRELTKILNKRLISEKKVSPSTVRRLLLAYKDILFKIEMRDGKYAVGLTREAEELMSEIISGHYKTIGQAYLARHGKNILTAYHDMLDKLRESGVISR